MHLQSAVVLDEPELAELVHENVAAAYKTIRAELKAYSPVLAAKPEIVVLNKCDALSENEIKAKARALKKVAKVDPRRMINSRCECSVPARVPDAAGAS